MQVRALSGEWPRECVGASNNFNIVVGNTFVIYLLNLLT